MKKISLITCQSIEKEIREVIKIKDLKSIEITSHFCNFEGNHSGECAIDKLVYGHQNKENILLLIKKSCIISQQSKKSTQELYFKTLENLHELFLPKNLVRHYKSNNYYLLTSGGTDFLLNKIDDGKLNEENIYEFAGSRFEKFLILETDIGVKTEKIADILQKKLKIPYKILPVGLDFLEMYLTKILTEFQLREAKKSSLDQIKEANEHIANYELAFEMLKTLTQLKKEKDVINSIMKAFETLFSPQLINFASIENGKIKFRLSNSPENSLDFGKIDTLLSEEKEYLLKDDDSFFLKLIYKGACLGIIEIAEIDFPKYLSRYLSLAIIIGRICALAINNARVYQKLERTLEQLKTSNEDLEQFAYMISHDLKQPLTIINGYLSLLKEIYQGKINRSPLKPLNEALNSSREMNQMISDILDYSRLSRKEENKELLDLNTILNKSISNLKTLIESTQAKITSEELPQVFADETVLIQIFQNLIENAIKYRSEKPPKINISSQKENHHYKIYIKDNGIGIDPKEKDKIFDLFYRSNKSKEISGSGIGLSICKKLIKRMGGEIGIESNSNGGSTFYFTLPILK